MRQSGFVALAFVLAAGVAAAQETDSDAEEQAADPRPQIRVLQDPYDIASFYRAGGPEWGYLAGAEERYPIASYYRGATNAGGYSRFWTSGYSNAYGSGRPQHMMIAPYAPYPGSYRSRIGENGDLFLLAPTFLAPVGPLTGVFFGSR
jgi:hypothetical protein